ncbi:hypothetical protein ACHAXA_001826 [Cyclostephanos tholiformis]|uniref:RNA exonuclease 4 n=1 Tax=Cyclostephanos tholiformis TaxID=382380 RepID=A0ABD3R9N5_9STRA
MANVFFTKKSKAMMRKRRRKMDNQRAAARGGGDDLDDDGHRVHDNFTIALAAADDDVDFGSASRRGHSGSIGGRKRTVDQISDGSSRTQQHAPHEPVDGNGISKYEPITVVIPRGISSKDAKKFRKDARRKARSEGRSEDSIVFVVEGGHSHKKGGGGATSSSSSADESSSSRDAGRNGGDDGNRARGGKDGARKKDSKKSSYPRINDILIQHAVEQKLKEKLKKQRSANDALTLSEKSKYVAVDCEMVGIGPDGKKSALARVSVVDWDCNVLLDTFVRVPERVTDFRTRVSGVRPRDISASNVNAMDHDEARIAVGNLLLGKVLVGHALKNDLSALMLSHPRDETRDTARYAPFMRPSGSGGGKLRPRKLRDLVYENLGRRIQVEGESHCSVDDARATMELFQIVRGRWEKELQQKSSSGGKKGVSRSVIGGGGGKK